MTTNLYAQEQWINQTESHHTGESDVYETFTDNRGELYHAMQHEYGRCIGKVYVDEGREIGWVFVKRQQYDNSADTFLLETWVTIHTAPPTKSIEYHYHQ